MAAPDRAGGALAGCGGGDGDACSARSASATPAKSAAPVNCSKAPELTARDVAGRPKGYKLVEMERDRAELIAGQLERGLGDRLKGYDVRIVARPRADAGLVAVFVFNTTEPAGPNVTEEIARGASDALEGTDRRMEPIEVGAEAGTLIEAADGAFIAISPAEECSFSMLIADTERMLRRGAALIPG